MAGSLACWRKHTTAALRSIWLVPITGSGILLITIAPAWPERNEFKTQKSRPSLRTADSSEVGEPDQAQPFWLIDST